MKIFMKTKHQHEIFQSKMYRNLRVAIIQAAGILSNQIILQPLKFKLEHEIQLMQSQHIKTHHIQIGKMS